MRHAVLVFIGVILLAIGGALQARFGTPTDEVAIRQIWRAHNQAYNQHDARAVAGLYALDGDQVNGSGAYFSGRAPIEKNYANNFNGAGRNATVQDESSTFRLLTTDVAILDTDAVYTSRTDCSRFMSHRSMRSGTASGCLLRHATPRNGDFVIR